MTRKCAFSTATKIKYTCNELNSLYIKLNYIKEFWFSFSVFFQIYWKLALLYNAIIHFFCKIRLQYCCRSCWRRFAKVLSVRFSGFATEIGIRWRSSRPKRRSTSGWTNSRRSLPSRTTAKFKKSRLARFQKVIEDFICWVYKVTWTGN